MRVKDKSLLGPERFDFIGTRHAGEHHSVEILCSLGLPDALDVMTRGDEVTYYLAFACRVARDAGADALSGVTYGTIGKTTFALATKAEFDASAAGIDRAAKSAKDLNMRLGIEPCNRYETHLLNTAQQVALIERIGADNIFIHLDTYHMNIEEVGMAKCFADAGGIWAMSIYQNQIGACLGGDAGLGRQLCGTQVGRVK